MLERYKIEVRDYVIEIYGDVPIHEAIELINFYQEKGFNTISGGPDHSIFISKTNLNSGDDDSYEDRATVFESMYEQEKSRNRALGERNLQLENLIKKLLDDHKDVSTQPLEI